MKTRLRPHFLFTLLSALRLPSLAISAIASSTANGDVLYNISSFNNNNSSSVTVQWLPGITTITTAPGYTGTDDAGLYSLQTANPNAATDVNGQRFRNSQDGQNNVRQTLVTDPTGYFQFGIVADLANSTNLESLTFQAVRATTSSQVRGYSISVSVDGGAYALLGAANVTNSRTEGLQAINLDLSAAEFQSVSSVDFRFAATGGGIEWTNIAINGFAGPPADTDADGLADLWEDLHFGDGDGTATPEELARQSGTDDGWPTADDDNLDNNGEQDNRTDPNVADSDSDGLNDGPEVNGTNNAGVSHGYGPTDPKDDDSDNGGAGDGIKDGDEVSGILNTSNSLEPTNPNSSDSDNDLMGDLYEITNSLLGGLDPNDITDGDPGADLDNDGLDNLAEHDRIPQTRADKADTDSDGYSDSVETNFGPDSWYDETDTGTNPVITDTDGDGLLDGDENPDSGSSPPTSAPYKSNPTIFDTDGDFYGDGTEVAAGTDPWLNTSVPIGLPVRAVDFSSTAGGWTIAGGTTLETTTELLPGSGQYALIDGGSDGGNGGRGVILKYPNPTVPTVVNNVANCSVDFRVDGAFPGLVTQQFNITSGASNTVTTNGTVHCIVRVHGDGSIKAFDGNGNWQTVLAAGTIVGGVTYTVELDHYIIAETYNVRIIEAATSTLLGSLSGVTTRSSSDPTADPLYFNVGMQTGASGWDVAIDNMSVTFATVSEMKITNIAFVGGDLKITFTPGGAGYILSSSDDLVVPFTEEANATYDGTDTFTVPAASLNPGKDFFRIETAP